MRVLIAFCLIVTLAQANYVDWNKVRRPHKNLPEFEDLIENDISGFRIIGGQNAKPEQFPYQVGTYKETSLGKGFCAGSLLNDEWVLTAAHCVYSPGNITVVLGAYNISEAEPEQVRITTSEVIYHEDFDPNVLKNDIAVIRLSEKVDFNERIQPVRLPTRYQAFDGFLSTVSGWGLNSSSSSKLTYTLQWVQNPIISNAECRKYFGSVITSAKICMSGSDGRSTCYGDSGGPLVITDTDGVPTEIGIVSYGSATCEDGYPGIYTRITSYLHWISEKTGIPIEL